MGKNNRKIVIHDKLNAFTWSLNEISKDFNALSHKITRLLDDLKKDFSSGSMNAEIDNKKEESINLLTRSDFLFSEFRQEAKKQSSKHSDALVKAMQNFKVAIKKFSTVQKQLEKIVENKEQNFTSKHR